MEIGEPQLTWEQAEWLGEQFLQLEKLDNQFGDRVETWEIYQWIKIVNVLLAQIKYLKSNKFQNN